MFTMKVHLAINTSFHFMHTAKTTYLKSEGYCSFIEQVIKKIKNTIIINQMTTIKCMATAVSGFIEQVGSMIKIIPKHNYHPSIPHNPSSFKELTETLQC